MLRYKKRKPFGTFSMFWLVFVQFLHSLLFPLLFNLFHLNFLPASCAKQIARNYVVTEAISRVWHIL